MSDISSKDNFSERVREVFQHLSTYFEGLITREASPFHFAARLNGEMPTKMQDTQRTLMAMMEERLAERGEKAASNLKAQERLRYYDEKIEKTIVSSGCLISKWIPWQPALTKRTRTTGIMLAGGFGLAATLVTLKAAGGASIKIPPYVKSPYLTAVIFLAIATLSGVAATHPEKVPTIIERERMKAKEHLAAYLRDAEEAFLDFIGKAEELLDTYIEKLQEATNT